MAVKTWLIGLTALGAMLTGPVASARAAVIYSFETEYVSPAGTLAFSGQLVFETAAASKGFEIHYCNDGYEGSPPSTPPYKPIGFDGLLGFRLSVADAQTGTAFFAPTQYDFEHLPGRAGSGNLAQLDLTGGPGRTLNGRIFYQSTLNSDVDSAVMLALTGRAFSGGYDTDGLGPEACHFTGQCTFGGTIRVSVPEPSSLSMLIGGAVALGFARWRKRGATA